MVEKIYEIIDEIKENNGIVVIVVLEGAGACHNARRPIAGDVDHKHLIILWCNAHLFNQLFGDCFTEPNQKIHVMKYALLFVLEWFNNHRVALRLLKLEQRAINGEESSLCTPGANRWNS